MSAPRSTARKLAAAVTVAGLASGPTRAHALDPQHEDEHRVLALVRWAVLSAATGSSGGVKLAQRVCGDVRSGAADLALARRAAAGASTATGPDVLYPKAAEQRSPFTVDAGLDFCAALEGRPLSNSSAAAIVDGPGGQRVSFAFAIDKATPHLVVPAKKDSADRETPPPPPEPTRQLRLDISAGMATPITGAADLYAAAPALRAGLAFSGERWDVSTHVVGFAAPMHAMVYRTSRAAEFGFIGLDVEPTYRVTTGSVLFSLGGRLAGGILGRNIESERRAPAQQQATPFGALGPTLRLELPLGDISPNLVLAPAVALVDADGHLRLHGHLSIWLGFDRKVGSL